MNDERRMKNGVDKEGVERTVSFAGRGGVGEKMIIMSRLETIKVKMMIVMVITILNELS